MKNFSFDFWPLVTKTKDLMEQGNKSIKFFPYLTKREPKEFLDTLTEIRYKYLHIHLNFENDSLFTLIIRNLKRNKKQKMHGFIFHDCIFFYSFVEMKLIQSTFFPFINEFFGEFQPIYLTTEAIQNMLESIFSEKDQLIVKKLVVKKFGTRTNRETAIRFVNLPVNIAFERIRRQNFWLNNILVESFNDPPVKFSISKKGTISIYKGDNITTFFPIFEYIAKTSKETSRKIGDRSRIVTPKHEVKPLVVDYKQKVSSYSELNKKIIEVISHYSFSGHAIIHAGNPHIYISIFDKLDGSSYAIRSLGESSLLIIPKIKTSRASLIRILSYLFENFAEGEISEYQNT